MSTRSPSTRERTTPRRPSARQRQIGTPGTLNKKISTLSSPNLGAAYLSLSPASVLRATNTIAQQRQSSLNKLTSGSLASIPDASDSYANSVLNGSPTPRSMGPRTPGGNVGGGVEVGDMVDVPGNMHGIVKFVGGVNGKTGVFAGVELSEEFASKGKNSGDVDGVSYFTTSLEGAGIFLPVARAKKREPEEYFPSQTPPYSGFRPGASISRNTPPTPSLPAKFSASVGPGVRPISPTRRSRPSLPRPESPVRKIAPPVAKPSINTSLARGASQRYPPSPSPNKFSQSIIRDPLKKQGFPTRSGTTKTSAAGSRSTSALGNTPVQFSDDDSSSIGMAQTIDQNVPISSFSARMRPGSSASRTNEEEVQRLRNQLEDKEHQLRDQASTLAEMENSLIEVQSLMSGDVGGSQDDRDTSQLRALLREKNDKIAMLTSEFDAHRADFRSTIDTLELASTETERVYEAKVQDLLAELQEYQDRSEDVDSVARQLKQLEELVQELEEGLEDARRGEAEARGEVEFLRGEVERGRSELRREREKAAAALNAGEPKTDAESSLAREVEQRDDEIRGLKAIIHSLSRDSVPDNDENTISPRSDDSRTPRQRNSFSRLHRSTSRQVESAEDRQAREKTENEVSELRIALDAKSYREEELERELEALRRGSVTTTAPSHMQRASATSLGSNGTATKGHSAQNSRSTIGSRRGTSPELRRRNQLESMPEAEDPPATGDSSSLWCEICETSGHDILTCTNMFGNQQGQHPPNFDNDRASQGSPVLNRNGKAFNEDERKPLDTEENEDFKPAPLSPVKKASISEEPLAPKIMPNPMESGPVAGKESGVIDDSRWCALCERDGHESVDCPFEDAF